MPRVLREYAMIADGRRGAIVGPAGDIAWLCAPRWDSDALFNTLIGGAGHYTVTPVDRHTWGGFYEDGSLIWRSRWITDGGRIECREALALPADPDTTVVLRRIEPIDTTAHLRLTLDPRAGYGTTALRDLHRHHGVWTARVGDLYLRWSGAADARRRTRNGVALLTVDVEVVAGAHRNLILEISARPLPPEAPDADVLWSATEAAWREAVPRLDDVIDPREARHHYAVLYGLTSPGGGTVAAATTSLPERSEADRNYDYRYVWVRDQCYIGRAAATVGGDGLLDDSVAFVADRLCADGDRLAPAYTVAGEAVPGERHVGLDGYPGGGDIIGNRVRGQFQLDAFGEALLLFAAAADRDRLDDHGWEAARAAVGAIGKRWQQPDAGIWEIDDRAWTHSRLIAA
ncbi:MAG TPA: glycoside hydrolase family 15 protein, partial [Micromonosporaceae bacterium]